ncbi:MAG: hypothetical protein LH624_18510 [Cryobacterium sp.]|nr:hypothetical protein [Cryobacterium sp.]
MAKRYRSHPAISAVIHDVQGTAITLEFGGRTVIWHHHEPDRVLAALARSTKVVVIEPCTAILIGRSNRHWFYCSTTELEPCTYPEE